MPGLAYLKGDCYRRQNKCMTVSIVFLKYNDMRGWMNLPGKVAQIHFEPCVSPLASVRPPTELCVACSSEIREQSLTHAMPKISRFSFAHP